MEIQWYPGHMTKAKRQMAEDIKLIDLVIELVDARCPLSSRNPEIDTLAKNKSRIVLLNKADLADKAVTKQWIDYFEKKGAYAMALDARKKNGIKDVYKLIDEASEEKRQRDLKRGIKNRPVRAMVAGIPNVGKSTFINSFAGKAATKTGNKPGVTKGKQWIRINKQVELLDTPGILWPKFEDVEVGINLACIGAIKDEVLNRDELALTLIEKLIKIYPGVINQRYDCVEDKPVSILENIAINRNCIKKGNEIDYTKASIMILDEFKSGMLGALSLERPQGIEVE